MADSLLFSDLSAIVIDSKTHYRYSTIAIEYNFSSRVKTRKLPMLFNGRVPILTFLGPKLELPRSRAYSRYLTCLWTNGLVSSSVPE